MPKIRPKIPKPVSEGVLNEFNHKCAACGHERPQLHHIDSNPENNAPLNLIPLCPNCHLVDTHNPTRPIEPGRVRLLRLYHDPTVLDPKFQPIYKRLELLRTALANNSKRDLHDTALSLRQFLKVFEKGAFYAEEFERILMSKKHFYWPGLYDSHTRNIESLTQDFASVEARTDCQVKLRAIEELIMELLRYQGWTTARSV